MPVPVICNFYKDLKKKNCRGYWLHKVEKVSFFCTQLNVIIMAVSHYDSDSHELPRIDKFKDSRNYVNFCVDLLCLMIL